MTNLKKIILEFVELGKEYRATNDKQVKDHYNNYAQIVIENEVDKEDQENIYSYWNGLKKGGN